MQFAVWPDRPAAVTVYVVVCDGFNVNAPLVGMLTPTWGETVTLVAFWVWKAMVAVWPAVIVAGVAVQPEIQPTVDAFEDAVVDSGGKPAEDSVWMAADGFGDVDDGLDAAVCGPEIPSFEVVFSVFRRLGIEILEDQPNLVGAGGFQMAASKVEGLELLFLTGREVVGVLEPDIAGAGEFRMELTFQAPDLIDGFVDEADDVELVEGEGGVGQMIAHAFDEGLRHVGADLGNGLGISLMGL